MTPPASIIPEKLIAAMRALAEETARLRFAPPVHTVYNPLIYAREPAERYTRRYARKCRALLVGMNPGPFGMAQTGIPFGEVGLAREWLDIDGRVERPSPEHPKRPIQGFSCPKSEVSGRRLWGFFRERFATPDDFFNIFFVTNYCPLVFMEESGRNLTPDKLSAGERAPLYAACDTYLQTTAALLEPEFVIGVGAFAAKRAQAALGDDGSRKATAALRFSVIPHPSPASPQANRGWSALALRALAELGLLP
ncbi:MAG: single-stranded DNA-binding protein [Spirochaetota bacterium]|nr:single-stranded DNA-binding protein [Spirochaetota bacterium]